MIEAETFKVYTRLRLVQEEDILEEAIDKNGDKWLKLSVYKYAKPEHISSAIKMANNLATRVVCESFFYSPEEILENEKNQIYSKSFTCRFRIVYKIFTKNEDNEHVYLKEINKEKIDD